MTVFFRIVFSFSRASFHSFSILPQPLTTLRDFFGIAVAATVGMLLTTGLPARADTFGSGADTFEIEFVPIGDPGNPADTGGSPESAGSVPYRYRMGKFEISEQMIEKANALGDLGITKDVRGPDQPATSVSWFEAARFVNWLNTSTGHSPAYKFVTTTRPAAATFALWEPGDPGYDPDNLYRNRLARYVLPSADEWYKAAFYDPATGEYFDYPTGSDDPPMSVASGDTPNTAIYLPDGNSGPADVMQAGGLSLFGTMGQGGNVGEWDESSIDLTNSAPMIDRGRRGGSWNSSAFGLSTFVRSSSSPALGLDGIGFRIARIPEPTSLLLVATGALLGFGLLRRTASKPTED